MPPAPWRRLVEASFLLPRAIYGFGHLGPRGPEDGPKALVIPGFLANDRTTMTLRRALAEGGWRTHAWDMGWNLGAAADTVERIGARLDAIGDGEKVLLVGWSLGGVFAREVARQFPDKVSGVATLGSPFSGDPHWNNVWKLYEWVAGHKVDDPPIPRLPDKPAVPTIAFWSRADGIVAPASARGLGAESDRTIEMRCSHMAFGVSRRTVRAVVREIDSFLKNGG